jgi:nitrite reductase/ring-hydroxylating ferredoxin subunit
MGDPRSDERRAGRLDRLVKRLLKGRRMDVTPSDAEERDAIMAAARLAASREARPHMSPGLRRRMAAMVGAEPPPAPPRSSWVSRRTALTGAVGLAAGLVAAVGGPRAWSELQGATSSTTPSSPTPITPTPRPVFKPGAATAHWTDTGLRLADLVEGVPLKVSAGAIDAFLVRRKNQVSALSAYCTHFPCELTWKGADHVLLCPCHNQTFTTEGISTNANYPLPSLPLVEVRVVNGRVEVLGT